MPTPPRTDPQRAALSMLDLWDNVWRGFLTHPTYSPETMERMSQTVARFRRLVVEPLLTPPSP